jgi:hypothetical protein
MNIFDLKNKLLRRPSANFEGKCNRDDQVPPCSSSRRFCSCTMACSEEGSHGALFFICRLGGMDLNSFSPDAIPPDSIRW